MTVGHTSDRGVPDVVYILRHGDDNEELRYSLRSLSNLPHHRVWLAGGQPSWTSNVQRLPVPVKRDKYTTIYANLEAVADCAELSERFVLFNDDFFLMRPVANVEPMHRGPFKQALRGYGSRRDAYTKRLRDAAERWPDGLCYDSTHVPMEMEKGRLRDVLDGPRTLWKSDYGNFHKVGGVQVKDVKIKRQKVPTPDAVWVSTSDASFKRNEVGKWVRRRLPDPSPYER